MAGDGKSTKTPCKETHEPVHGAPATATTEAEEGGFSWLTLLGLTFLTFNSGMAIYRSNGDVGSVAFVMASYLDLVVLFICLRWYERAGRTSGKEEHQKAAVWGLTTLLTVVFSYKVSEIMPLPVLVVCRAMAWATVHRGGFYAFFIHREQKADVSPKKNKVEPETTAVLATLGHSSNTATDGTTSGGAADPSAADGSSFGGLLIADTGAAIHAVGDRSLLVDVKPSTMYTSVKLPAKDALLDVLGVGRIEWKEPESENVVFSIPNVYLVEGLEKSIISISQLDRDHGIISVFGTGKCELMLADGTPVGGANLDERDRMYVLRFLQVPKPAQV